MNELGKFIFIGGVILALIGLILWTGVGRGWFGQLPGDVNFSRGNSSFHFPIVTCILISVVLTVLFSIFRK